jgi:hypothetical protein
MLFRMAIFRVPINLTFPGAGSPGANIWHIRTVTPTSGSELSEANTLIGYLRAFYVAMQPYLALSTVVSLGTVTEVGTAREIVPTMATVTSSGVDSAPQALAVVVTWRTTIAARRGRGRTFVGPITKSVLQTDGTIVDGTRTTMATAAGALVTSSMGFGNGAVGVYGYNDAKTPGKENPRNPADARVFRDFTGYQIRDLFGVLRSRRD